LLVAFFAIVTAAHAAPTNDDFAHPKTFSAIPPGDISTSNGGATKQLGEPDHAGDPGGHSVWFSWTPAASGTAELATCTDEALDTVLAVYIGATVDALTPIASSDDAPVGSGSVNCRPTDSVVQFNAEPSSRQSLESSSTSYS
jgi:hypothetical protein